MRRKHGQQGPKRGRRPMLLPAHPPPAGRRAVSICIPDEPTWQQLWWGHVNKLSMWLQYERDDQKLAKPTADVWRDIITEAIICADDEVTDCMAVKITDAVCQAIDLCLEPRMASRHAEIMAALAALQTTTTTINNRTITIGDYIVTIGDRISTTTIRNYNTLPPTPDEKSGAQPIAETKALQASGITLEQFYGACISIVDGLVGAMTDYFERLEAISNALELTATIAESIPLPVISDIAEAASAAAELANFVQEVAMEMFLAADTTPRRLNLAGKLYCKGRHVKALDMNMIGEALAEAWIGDLIDWNDPIGSLARIATGEFAPEQVFYISLGLGLAIWTVTGDFEGLITRAAWRYWVNAGKNSPQSPVPECGSRDFCIYEGQNFQNNTTILFGYGSWAANGLRSYPGDTVGYAAVVFRIQHTGAALWQRVEIDTTIPATASLAATRVSRSNVYAHWENLTATPNTGGLTFAFEYPTPQTTGYTTTEILIESWSGSFTVRRVRFYEATHMEHAECVES